ncbi:MAG: ABC transporter ATP-binding protein [Christensenellaceae bacterium]|nr:ABC transporter ATP-binding protein [Christensenellaceae bacterium]MEA5065014.1 ABC transporter ATP-binding protein [Eubacteriales bacterium]MEA5070149.1 ABC transporter ATP-binding protein [Christensenellaceae bacterium]
MDRGSGRALVQIKRLKTFFPVRKGVFRRVAGHVKAVNDVSLTIYRGETLGLVGESGCGKTTLGKSILRLTPGAEGEILYDFDGEPRDLMKLDEREMLKAREKMQIVFQDPYSSLNPAFTIFGSLEDSLRRFGVRSKAERRRRVGELLEAVNLRGAYMDRYPHEFSGGQRQRIGIARALLVDPELIVCDECVSALDVSIQAQVLALLERLKAERGLTYLFITHDLSVVEYMADRIAVMYLGRVVELADAGDLYKNALHPYTQALLSAIPVADLERRSKRIVLQGDVPSPVDPPDGCAFHPRCPDCMEVCRARRPALTRYLAGGREHFVACHLKNDAEESFNEQV